MENNDSSLLPNSNQYNFQFSNEKQNEFNNNFQSITLYSLSETNEVTNRQPTNRNQPIQQSLSDNLNLVNQRLLEENKELRNFIGTLKSQRASEHQSGQTSNNEYDSKQYNTNKQTKQLVEEIKYLRHQNENFKKQLIDLSNQFDEAFMDLKDREMQIQSMDLEKTEMLEQYSELQKKCIQYRMLLEEYENENDTNQLIQIKQELEGLSQECNFLKERNQNLENEINQLQHQQHQTLQEHENNSLKNELIEIKNLVQTKNNNNHNQNQNQLSNNNKETLFVQTYNTNQNKYQAEYMEIKKEIETFLNDFQTSTYWNTIIEIANEQLRNDIYKRDFHSILKLTEFSLKNVFSLQQQIHQMNLEKKSNQNSSLQIKTQQQSYQELKNLLSQQNEQKNLLLEQKIQALQQENQELNKSLNEKQTLLWNKLLECQQIGNIKKDISKNLNQINSFYNDLLSIILVCCSNIDVHSLSNTIIEKNEKLQILEQENQQIQDELQSLEIENKINISKNKLGNIDLTSLLHDKRSKLNQQKQEIDCLTQSLHQDQNSLSQIAQSERQKIDQLLTTQREFIRLKNNYDQLFTNFNNLQDQFIILQQSNQLNEQTLAQIQTINNNDVLNNNSSCQQIRSRAISNMSSKENSINLFNAKYVPTLNLIKTTKQNNHINNKSQTTLRDKIRMSVN